MGQAPSYRRVASYRTARELAEHLEGLGWRLPFDDGILTGSASPLARPLVIPWPGGPRRVGNRFAVQPMEGWDGELDGCPSPLTRQRWLRFAAGGAKLIWGCEAVAILPEARANPNQLLLNDRTASSFGALREEMVRAHRDRFGATSDFLIGLQLTHSGRFSRPRAKSRLEPIIAYHHPLLDAKFPAPSECQPVSDEEIRRIIEAFARAARLTEGLGFDFVDLKHCHGYLGHELLGATDRPGPYGGCFENRTRFLKETIAAVRAAAPRLAMGVRLSAYDSIPFVEDAETGRGIPAALPGPAAYTWGFGVNPRQPWQADLTESKQLLKLLEELGVPLVNISAGSPYYSAHIQRPALFPPCDAYLPPEDPLVGAARLQQAARDLKQAAPGMVIVSSGWSYFQNYLPHFAQAVVREGWSDAVGLGRMILPYPDLPANVFEAGRLDPRKICRTFSDCTNGPRNGMVSGCFPLDPVYRARPEAKAVAKIRATRWSARFSYEPST
ncbi:MAG: NADH:flavin oxidoreductase [Acidobacteria bacterium]|nr:MAG: NADH:flavin oxidoreductase [Acidobacteriota bacterium]